MAVGSFSAGLSGLNANAVYLSVIGNNLANINTIGFKSSSVSFMDLVSQTVGGSSGNPMQVGLGVVTGSISPVFSQGTIENTREATNVAIQGGGLFVVRGADGTSYSRAGQFSFDNKGTLVSPDGYKVQGYTTTDPTTGSIIVTGQPTDITIPPGVLRPPVATTVFGTTSNLDAATPTGTAAVTTVQLYDALGEPHVATITYTKGAAAGAWTYNITVPGAEITGGTTGTPFSVGSGALTFDATGKLASFTAAAPATGGGTPPADVTFTTPTWKNGAAASALTWDMVDANGKASITGFSAPSATSSKVQNGSAPGMVDNISISADGTIVATVGAGQTVSIGRLALATFNNLKGLVKLGSNRYGETQAAGLPNVGVAGTGGRGTLIGSALEQSNVDIAQEFTQMILAQRGYQANSKTITVSDEILVDTLNLKR
jgi:flagellar hook protein FlgE